MDSKGYSKLADFGQSKILNSDGKTSTLTGGLLYVAPEVVDLKRPYDYCVDYWSLGICIYYMLTGEKPFKDDDEVINNQIPDLNLKRQLKDEKHEISSISFDLVKRILIKDPEIRKENIQKLKDDPFYNNIDWQRLEKGQMKPPFKPKVVCFKH